MDWTRPWSCVYSFCCWSAGQLVSSAAPRSRRESKKWVFRSPCETQLMRASVVHNRRRDKQRPNSSQTQPRSILPFHPTPELLKSLPKTLSTTYNTKG